MSDGATLALSGGVGGAKLALGLAKVLPPSDLTVLTNVADDFTHLGLHISPDLDTVMYTLAGLANPQTGWGLNNETWQFMEALKRLRGETWFQLGDQDLATHVLRTRALKSGQTLTEVTRHLCQTLGIEHDILPATDDPLRTIVHTNDKSLAFQHYFVRDKCEPKVLGFEFDGLEAAKPSPAIVDLFKSTSLRAIIICPSNPFVSVDPILKIPGMMDLMRSARCPIIAVSPIIGGKAIKGPAAKMMKELGLEVGVDSIAEHYDGLIDGLVIDELDKETLPAFASRRFETIAIPTLMTDLTDKIRLAEETLRFADRLS